MSTGWPGVSVTRKVRGPAAGNELGVPAHACGTAARRAAAVVARGRAQGGRNLSEEGLACRREVGTAGDTVGQAGAGATAPCRAVVRLL
jgi:hypothetical protein